MGDDDKKTPQQPPPPPEVPKAETPKAETPPSAVPTGEAKAEQKPQERPRFAPRSTTPTVMEEVGKHGSKREFVPAKRPSPQVGDKKPGSRHRPPRASDSSRGEKGEAQDEFTDRLVSINRVAKVVKGGRRFGFSALVVIGDSQGRVGYGTGKAKEISEAVRKATEKGKRKMIKITLREGRTLHHDIIGHYGSGRVVMRAAAGGTGIIAGGPIRAVFEVLGVKDVVAKSIGSSNPHNMVKAAFAGLQRIHSPRSIAAKRGLAVSHFFGNKGPPRRPPKDKTAAADKSADKSAQAGKAAKMAKPPPPTAKTEPTGKPTGEPAGEPETPQVKTEPEDAPK